MHALTRRAFLMASMVAPIATRTYPAPALAQRAHLQPDLRSLPGYVQHVMQKLQVPGAAVAVVQGDRTVFCHGFGVKDLSSGRPVTEHTLFSLASQTKPFTGTCLAILESEGRLQGERPVIDYLPDFRMSSPQVTRRMKVNELLSHGSGLPAHAGDQLFFPPTDYSLEQVVARIGKLPLLQPFLSTFAYENVLYAAAALLIRRVSGMDYEQFLSSKIFKPLGMRSTVPNANHLTPADDVATGYCRLDGVRRSVRPLVWANNPGAGGIYSSASDLARWMRMHLRGGVYPSDGTLRRLYSKRAQQEMWAPRIRIPQEADAAVTDRVQFADLAYGSGWFLSDYRGERLVWHSGEFPGFVSRMSLMPSRDLGIVVLTNQEDNAAFQAITNYVLDLVVGAHDIDWLTALMREDEAERRANDKELARVLATRTLGEDAAVDCSAYEGIYRDTWYGNVTIHRSAEKCLMHFEHTAALLGELQPWSRDTFAVRWRDRLLRGDALVVFERDEAGAVAGARMKRLSPFETPAWDFGNMHLLRTQG